MAVQIERMKTFFPAFLAIEIEEEDRSMEVDLTRSEVGRLADWLDDLTTEAEG